MLLAWWIGTAAVLRVSRAVGFRRRSWLALSTCGVAVALAALRPIAMDADPQAALVGALLGFAVWFWVETTFYTGWITGLRVTATAAGASWPRRLGRAVKACLWHECSR